MKSSRVILSLCFFSLAACPLASGAEQAPKAADKTPTADEQTEAGFKLMKTELLGKLRFEMKAKQVVEFYGKPATQGKMENWEGVGLFVQQWDYPALGLELQMAAEKARGEQTVYMIKATRPCKLATTQGIKIGSTEAEVIQAYTKWKGEESKPGEMFVAGSTVGGVIFTIKEGKVSEIFIGAASE
ncbi:hypothetical protein [Prosthecobacter sp.]|uniref:hypothetical protein n=1 Tax=Prosthecobacter sp. TaxID=1965333 RepID=UPI0037848387